MAVGRRDLRDHRLQAAIGRAEHDRLAAGEAGAPQADVIRADYLDSYAGDRYLESMRYVRRYPEELPQLSELLPQITTQ